MNQKITSILLVVGIIVIVNAISNDLFFRLDLTEDKQFTLSNATKDILRNMDTPATVTVYFTEGLPVQFAKNREDLQDLLIEYSNISKGMVEYEFIDPSANPDTEQELNQLRIPPRQFNVREKDQIVLKNGYMAAVIKMGEGQEIIPFIQSGTGMEYSFTTGIKKLSVIDKPSIGFIQGHGEPGFQDIAQVYQGLDILYSIQNIDLNAEASIPDRFKTVALLNPTDSIPPAHFAKLDEFLNRGGNLFVAINAVDGNLQNAQGTALTTGLETWLQTKGVIVEPSFVVDASCAPVTVQQRQGFFTMNTQVSFPYLPIIKAFPDHPITKGLEQVLLPFVSPIRWAGDSLSTFTSFLQTSTKSGIVSAPTMFDVNKKWNDSDFPLPTIDVGGILESQSSSGLPYKVIIISDGDFPIGGQGGQANPDNVNLMVNSIDWLSDDTGLIELRTKGIVSRPIKDEYLGDEAAGKRSFIKYLNFGLPLLLVIFYGIFRNQKQRNRRIRRMQERYA